MRTVSTRMLIVLRMGTAKTKQSFCRSNDGNAERARARDSSAVSAASAVAYPSRYLSLPTSIVDVKPLVPEWLHFALSLACVCDTERYCV